MGEYSVYAKVGKMDAEASRITGTPCSVPRLLATHVVAGSAAEAVRNAIADGTLKGRLEDYIAYPER
jgi:hypothetical protein